jgi:predicted  nucleic acid-binding Zn ribbon protein
MKIFKILAERERQDNNEAQLESLDFLLGAYRADGHVLGRELMTLSLDQRIEAYLFAPAADAFHPKNLNKWTAKRSEELKSSGLMNVQIVLLGDDLSEPDECTCDKPNSYILFTTYIQVQSPARCGDCFKPIPLYRLPRFKNNDFQEVISWADDYKSCDSLFMNSATGERFGYREMSQANNSLSKRGRAICAHFESGTGKAAYYYLHRYYGHGRAAEEARKCPLCGGDWRLSTPWHLFDFKCEQCRLVSSLSSSVT